MQTFNDLVKECRNFMLETNIIPPHNVILRNLDELSKEELKTIIVNYTGFTNFSIHCLLDCAVRLHQWRYMQKAALDNITEELGRETDNVPHLELMRYGFRNELGIETENQEYMHCTHEFFDQLKYLLNARNKAALTGALCAFEGIAVPEFHILCPIVEKFIGRELDPEWESYRYIEGHKTFEIGHEQDLLNNAALYITQEHYADFKIGYQAMVVAFDAWWTNLYLGVM
jgi:hypothetical protein